MPKKKGAKKESRVVRISAANYVAFTKLKSDYARRKGVKKVTYDAFLENIFSVVEMVVKGKEIYSYGNRLYADIAEARGDALTEAIRNKAVPMMPLVLLVVGEDTFLRDGHA